ncbi:isatin hydrolase-like [Dermacentor andersoni]|uniref:isatin hydrolase-like n=1 Tax=Dermacentor andersoni TaxID=34620 RepID=UPI002155BB12|nr:isatin hydrolase-like isoform X1 [Dermacentor andersoni]
MNVAMASSFSAIILLMCASLLSCIAARIPSSCGGLFVPPEKLVDLSYSFNNRTIFWSDDAEFRLNISRKGSTPEDWYQADVIELATHGGTHLDAPIHFAPDKWTVSQIPLERLMFVPIALVDVEAQASENPVYELSLEDIERWEGQHGHVPRGALLIERTGRSKLWPNRNAYLGIDDHGWRRFPTVSFEAARFLVEQRQVYGIGLDSPSVDLLNSSAPHRVISANNVYILENLADLSRLPALGATAIVMPIKVCQASGAPVRVVAILP